MTYATWSFQFNAATSVPPTGNQVRLDNADQVAATHLYVMHSTNDGLDVTAALARVVPGDHVRIQDFDDSSRWQTYNVTAWVDMGTWTDFTVVWVNGATAIPAQKVALTVFQPEAPGIPPGGEIGDVLVKTGTEDYSVAWQAPDGSSVPSPITAGCEAWPITWACDIADVNPALLDAAEHAAQSILWAYGGRNIGRCVFTEGYYPPCAGCPGAPYKTASGQWRNGGGVHDCCHILLARQPVASVESVVLRDGAVPVVLDADGYTLDGAWLHRIGECWPCGDDCSRPPVEVTYTAGRPLPGFTASAMGEVACEVLYGLQGAACKLPSRAVTVTRQGVTVQLAAADDLASRMRLGLPIADAWLALVNPSGLQQASRVYSPDLARRGA